MKIHIKPVGPIGTNCYIVEDENGACAIIDPGAQGEKLVAFLQENQLTPGYILLTHGHYDHIGGAVEIQKRFPEAKIVIGKEDAEQLSDTEKSLAAHLGRGKGDYVMEPDLLVAQGDEITIGTLTFSVLDTPGHTKGCITYRIGDTLFTGDVLFHGSVGRTDLYGGDYTTLMVSVKKLAALEGDFHIMPGHGMDTTLDVERNENPYLQER